MLWTVACQGPLSLRFPRQKYWSGLPFPPPADLPDAETEPMSFKSPALAGRFFTTSATWTPLLEVYIGLPLWLSGNAGNMGSIPGLELSPCATNIEPVP